MPAPSNLRVQRFVRKLRGTHAPEARVVIVTRRRLAYTAIPASHKADPNLNIKLRERAEWEIEQPEIPSQWAAWLYVWSGTE